MADKVTTSPSAELDTKAAPKTDMELYGVNAVTIAQIPAKTVFSYQAALNWEYRDFPATQRPSLESFIFNKVLENGQKAVEYAEAQAYQKMERLIFKLAKQRDVKPSVVALEMKFQLKD